MKSKLFSIIMALLLVMSVITGCGKEPVKEVEETPEPTAAIKVLGEEKEGSTIVELTNKTGKEINEIYVKTSDTEEEQQNLLAENETIALNETFKLVFNSVSDEAEASNDGKVISTEYIVHIAFTNGESCELHSFPVGDIENGTINVEEDIVYLVYKSVSTGEEVNTLEAEKAVAELSEADTGASAQTGNSGGNYSAPSTGSSSAVQQETPTTEGGSSTDESGDEDGCLSDGLTY